MQLSDTQAKTINNFSRILLLQKQRFELFNRIRQLIGEFEQVFDGVELVSDLMN